MSVADSAFLSSGDNYHPDSLLRTELEKFIVAWSVLDTVQGPLVEWRQYVIEDLGSKIGSSDTSAEHLLGRLLIRCDSQGVLDTITNYNEVKSRIDTMLRQAWTDRGVDSSTIESILSTNGVMDAFTPSMNIFHAWHSAEILHMESIEGLAVTSDSDVLSARFPYLLDGGPSRCGSNDMEWLHGVAICDTVDLQDAMNGIMQVGEADQLWGTMRTSIELCLDTSDRTIERLRFSRSSITPGVRVVRTVTFEQP